MGSNLLRNLRRLCADGSNAVLVCRALSGNHHAAGFHSNDTKPGWWDTVIGPGKPIDTNRFFGVPNNSGCDGSTGPNRLCEAKESPGGLTSPSHRGRLVETQKRLAEHLNVQHWAAVIGGSLGYAGAGMVGPVSDWVSHCVAIAAAPVLPHRTSRLMRLLDGQYFQTLSGTMEITWKPLLTLRRAWHWRVWWATSPICPPTR